MVHWLREHLHPSTVLVAFFAITFPLWCNAFLSPPDSASYFAVPRSIVRDGDLDFQNDYAALEFEWNLAYLTGTGRLSNDWPVGSGVIWLPAYAGAELVARITPEGYAFPPDAPARSAALPRPLTIGAQEPVLAPTGQSGIYKLAISLLMGTASCLALGIGWKLARPYAGPWSALAAAFAVFLGTPIVFYTYAYGMMSHINSLLAVGILFWGWNATRTTPEEPKKRALLHWFLLGIAAGVMAMIRPQNVGFLSIFLVEAAFLGRALPWKRWAAGTGIAAAGALAAFSPQFIIWGLLYGNPFQLPKIEEMHWFAPELLEFLFSGYHGFVSWSPVVVLAVGGLYFLGRKDRVMAWAVGIVVVLQIYLNAANEIWWAGGSFGARRMVNCGVPLIIAMAALFGARRWTMALAIPLVVFTLLLMGKERAGELSLDHYVPWNGGFYAALIPFLNPVRWLGAMMGDFAGFGWISRLLMIGAGLGAAAAWQMLLLPRTQLRRGIGRAAAGMGAGWFLAAPLVFAIAAARTGAHRPESFAVPPARENRSLFNGYYEYGYYNLMKGRYERAKDAYWKARELAPHYPQTYRYLAYLELVHLGDPAAAFQHAEMALEIQPHYPAALAIMQEAMTQLNVLDPAGRSQRVAALEARRRAAQAAAPGS